MVGEIYDEDDENDFVFSEDTITFQEDSPLLIHADVDVNAILGLSLDEEEVLKEYGTLSSFLSFCTGEIPHVSDFVMSHGWNFEVVAGDVKRIFQVKVEGLLGFFEGDSDDESGDESLVRGFSSRMNAANDEGTTSMEINTDESSDMEQQLAEESAADIAVDATDVTHDEDKRHAEVVSR